MVGRNVCCCKCWEQRRGSNRTARFVAVGLVALGLLIGCNIIYNVFVFHPLVVSILFGNDDDDLQQRPPGGGQQRHKEEEGSATVDNDSKTATAKPSLTTTTTTDATEPIVMVTTDNKSSSTSTTTSFVQVEKHTSSIPWRAFPTWEQEMGTDVPLPCVYNQDEARAGMMNVKQVQWSKARTGLLFVKPEKTGSSTFAGIVARIAHIVYHRSSEKEKRRRHYYSSRLLHDDTDALATTTINNGTNVNEGRPPESINTVILQTNDNYSNPLLHDEGKDLSSVEKSNYNTYIFETSETNYDSSITEEAADTETTIVPNELQNMCKFRGLTHLWSRRSSNDLYPEKHKSLQQQQQEEQRPSNRFLWSIVRRVPNRDISHYFHFMATRQNAPTTDDAILGFLKKLPKKVRNIQLKSLYYFPKEIDIIARRASRTRQRRNTQNSTEMLWSPIIDRVLHKYNFLGTLERMDESMVLLQLIMGLKPSDMIPLDAKVSSRKDSYDSYTGCKPFVKSFVSPKVKEYLASDEYYHTQEGDFLLYDAIHKSMDHTIETVIGVDKFQRALEEYRQVKHYATMVHNCTSINLCSSKGVRNPDSNGACYSSDMGCGHQCLDDLFGWD